MSTYRAQAEAVEAALRIINGANKPRASELVLILDMLKAAADTLRRIAEKDDDQKRERGE
jgi:hypothetical protein